jgi:AAHS family 4-hydroxybenzoate transporter-like MFS transporter
MRLSGSSDTAAISKDETKRGWGGFVLILLALVVEGFDLQAANFAAPSIEEAFNLTRAQIGPLLSASLVGVLFGAMFIGPLGDRFGRRTILITACVTYGLLSLVATFASNLTQLIGLRFLIGIGLGAVLPNALALAGELAPRRHLATATGLVGIGITFGGVVAGAVAAHFLPTHGWQSLFVAGGILPIAIAVLLWLALPESPSFRPGDTGHRKASGVRAIVAPEYRARTLAIWCIFPLVLMVVYLLSGWIPLLVKDQGYDIATTSWIATTSHVGGVAGGITASLMLARGHWKVVALFAALSVVSLAILAAHDWGMGMLITLLLLVGFFSTGTQNGLNGSTSATYPAAMRASGLGWALGLGRVGSILGPLAGSLAILIGLTAPRHFFIIALLPLVVAAGLALWLARAQDEAAPIA